jgi:beta-lactam-binding protein with PASTA domain
VSVPNVVPLREDLAIARLQHQGLGFTLHREPNETFKVGQVFKQDPAAGVRLDKGSKVDIYVSTGPPKVDVPDVTGESRDSAIAKLTRAGLEYNPVEVFSSEEPGKVIAQFPEPGTRVKKGSKVRINISRGVKPVTVPNVVGQPYDNAAGQLQAAHFAVARKDVDSSQPKDVVIDQKPRGGEGLSRGGTVTLYVSKGPKTSTIPDVTSQDEDSARQALERSGFTVDVQDEVVTDPSQDGIVLTQDPPGGTEAKPGSTVTITVGRLPTP